MEYILINWYDRSDEKFKSETFSSIHKLRTVKKRLNKLSTPDFIEWITISYKRIIGLNTIITDFNIYDAETKITIYRTPTL